MASAPSACARSRRARSSAATSSRRSGDIGIGLFGGFFADLAGVSTTRSAHYRRRRDSRIDQQLGHAIAVVAFIWQPNDLMLSFWGRTYVSGGYIQPART